MDKNKKILLIIIFISVLVIAITGATFAYWSWSTSNAQKTEVTFTVASGFSCSADGGGNITSSNVQLVPASCTNSTYAIKRTVTVSPTINIDGGIYMDLWLKVNSIGSGLANSQNFKYALTTSSSNCTTGVVAQGNFNGATTNTQKTLLHNKAYSQTTTETYYLWIWLDAAETSTSTQNQTFSMELGGVCTNSAPSEQTVYTVNLYDENATNYNSVIIGSQISNTITQYNTPEAAMAALKTAGGGTTDYPFYLKHTVGDFSEWCIIMNNDTSNCLYSAPTGTDCNTVLQGAPDDGNTYTCSNITASNAVTESYVGFVVTPAMATANPGMVAGTYYLKGGDNGAFFLDNAKTIYDAFGGVGCYLDDNSGGNPYTTTPSSSFNCEVSGLNAYAYSTGDVGAADDNAGSYCRVNVGGDSRCNVGR